MSLNPTQKPFIGRERELNILEQLAHQQGPKLVVIKGRRRIGKSRLVEEFAKSKTFFSFTGLPPTEEITAQDQLDAFSKQYCERLKLPYFVFKDWSDAFNHLTLQIPAEPTVILFDEISWIGSKDPTFIPKLKVWWDLYLQKFPRLIVIFCGSVSTWIEKNIVNSTAFFGRISLQMTLVPLSLSECGQFLRTIGFKGSSYEIFEILCVTGGVPWYLEKIDPHQMADENLKRLCFTRDSLLVGEYDRIFNDLFGSHGKIHKEICHALGEGDKTQADLRKALRYAKSGSLSKFIGDLITCGYVSKHYQWSLKTNRLSKQSLYRLSDCYLRFYLKYIEPNRQKIEQGTFQEVSIQHLPGWDAMVGIQTESLLLENRSLLINSVGINPADIVNDNPYFQSKTKQHRGCQIDYLIQTYSQNLFVCEFKVKRRTLTPEIIEEMQEKISRFAYPRVFGVVPVLFHLGDVSHRVYDKKYFFRIIDISQFLEG